jgi:hypothetical protein
VSKNTGDANQVTAKKLGMIAPLLLLGRADEVIE